MSIKKYIHKIQANKIEEMEIWDNALTAKPKPAKTRREKRMPVYRDTIVCNAIANMLQSLDEEAIWQTCTSGQQQ